MSSEDVINQFMDNYHAAHFEETAKLVRRICEEGLKGISERGGGKVQAIVTHRSKKLESLRKKIENFDSQRRAEGKRPFESTAEIDTEIWDRAGVRIALYFPNQNEAVSQMIREKFAEALEISHPRPPGDGNCESSQLQQD